MPDGSPPQFLAGSPRRPRVPLLTRLLRALAVAWSLGWPALLIVAGGAISFVAAGGLAPTRIEPAACGVVVTTLLTTRDPLELSRAATLAQLLGCNVAARMPPAGAPAP